MLHVNWQLPFFNELGRLLLTFCQPGLQHLTFRHAKSLQVGVADELTLFLFCKWILSGSRFLEIVERFLFEPISWMDTRLFRKLFPWACTLERLKQSRSVQWVLISISEGYTIYIGLFSLISLGWVILVRGTEHVNLAESQWLPQHDSLQIELFEVMEF